MSHREVDRRLGTVDDLDALIAAAAARGVGVVLDGAFAYTSRRFHRFTAGWRLDSAWSVPAALGRRVLARVRESHPNAWFLGQVFDDDLPPVVNSTTVSGATEYALMHGTRKWLTGGPVEEVGRTSSWTAGGPDALLRPPMTLVDLAAAPDLLGAIRLLGRFRHRNPWLTSAVLGDVDTREGVLGYTVSGPGRAIRVLLNPTTEPAAVPAGEPLLAGAPAGATELAPLSWRVRSP